MVCARRKNGGWQTPPKCPGKLKHRGRDPKEDPRYTWEDRTQSIWRKEGLNRTEEDLQPETVRYGELFVIHLQLPVEEVRVGEVKWSEEKYILNYREISVYNKTRFPTLSPEFYPEVFTVMLPKTPTCHYTDINRDNSTKSIHFFIEV